MSLHSDLVTSWVATIDALTPTSRQTHRDRYQRGEVVVDPDGPPATLRLYDVTWGPLTDALRPVTTGVPVIRVADVQVSVVYPYSEATDDGRTTRMVHEDAEQIADAIESRAGYATSSAGHVYAQLFESHTLTVIGQALISTLVFRVEYST